RAARAAPHTRRAPSSRRGTPRGSFAKPAFASGPPRVRQPGVRSSERIVPVAELGDHGLLTRSGGVAGPTRRAAGPRLVRPPAGRKWGLRPIAVPTRLGDACGVQTREPEEERRWAEPLSAG